MLAGLLKLIGKSPSKTAVKSEASKARNAISKNPRMKGDKEAAAIAKINQREKEVLAAIEKRKEDAKPKPKKRPPADKDKRMQSPKEREGAATGRVSAKTTTQQNKKDGVGSMVSYTSMARGKAIAEAGKDLRSGKITQAQHDRIIDRIDAKNEAEVSRASNKASEGARSRKMQDKVSLKEELPPLKSTRDALRTTPPKKPSDLTRAELEEMLKKQESASAAARAKAKTRRGFAGGGMANCGASMKPTQGSTKKMAYGGMAKKKMSYGGMASKNKK